MTNTKTLSRRTRVGRAALVALGALGATVVAAPAASAQANFDTTEKLGPLWIQLQCYTHHHHPQFNDALVIRPSIGPGLPILAPGIGTPGIAGLCVLLFGNS